MVRRPTSPSLTWAQVAGQPRTRHRCHRHTCRTVGNVSGSCLDPSWLTTAARLSPSTSFSILPLAAYPPDGRSLPWGYCSCAFLLSDRDSSYSSAVFSGRVEAIGIWEFITAPRTVEEPLCRLESSGRSESDHRLGPKTPEQTSSGLQCLPCAAGRLAGSRERARPNPIDLSLTRFLT